MYHDIADDIMQRIANGEFTHKLPTEAALMAHYGVSRNTIRRAIDVVYQRGFLRRIQGSGYYVNELPTQSKAIINLSTGPRTTMHSTEFHLTSKVVSFEKMRADEEIAARMRIPVGEPLYHILRLRYLEDELYCLEDAYYLIKMVPVLTRQAISHSIFDFIAENYDIHTSSSENFIGMTQLNEDQAKLLETTGPCMTLDQLNYCGNAQIFNYSTATYAYPDLRFYFNSPHMQHS